MGSTAGLTTIEKKELRRVDPQALLEQAIAKDASVETLERLFSLAKDVRAEQAKEAWNRAMVAFQKACPKIKKDARASIPTKGGGKFGYSYASLDGVMAEIVPIMTDLDLSISWRHKVESGKVTANCRISHGLGHFEESGEVAMPISDDGAGANAAQRVGIALTYAKRYSLLSIVGIAPEDDPDAHGAEMETAKQPAEEPPTRLPRSPDEESFVISEAQHKRMWAIAFKTAKEHGSDAKELMNSAIKRKGFDSSKDVTVQHYNAICEDLMVPF